MLRKRFAKEDHSRRNKQSNQLHWNLWRSVQINRSLSNFRTPNNFKYPLFFSSKIAGSKQTKDKRRWMVLVKKEKKRRKLLR